MRRRRAVVCETADRNAPRILRGPRRQRGRRPEISALDRADPGSGNIRRRPTWADGLRGTAGCCCSIRTRRKEAASGLSSPDSIFRLASRSGRTARSTRRPTRPSSASIRLPRIRRGTMETIIQRTARPAHHPVRRNQGRGQQPPAQAIHVRQEGRIFVNVGSPTDDCVTRPPITKPCPAGEGPTPLAAIWAFTPPPAEFFRRSDPNDPNPPPRDLCARPAQLDGACGASEFSASAAIAFLQGENGRDLPDMFKPNEEINAIEKGKHYGWPYCYDLSTPSPEFRSVPASRRAVQGFLQQHRCVSPPYSLLPPHGAPLSMLYYHGGKFPEVDGKLIVGLHGYRPDRQPRAGLRRRSRRAFRSSAAAGALPCQLRMPSRRATFQTDGSARSRRRRTTS